MRNAEILCVDVETTGLRSSRNSILSIGAVGLVTGEEFYAECCIWSGAEIDLGALRVNGFTLAQANDQARKTEAQLITEFLAWVMKRDFTTMAGMNPQFDFAFIGAASGRAGLRGLPFSHRLIDIHSCAWLRTCDLPGKPVRKLDSDGISAFSGVTPEAKPHNALNGARQVRTVLSALVSMPCEIMTQHATA